MPQCQCQSIFFQEMLHNSISITIFLLENIHKVSGLRLELDNNRFQFTLQLDTNVHI